MKVVFIISLFIYGVVLLLDENYLSIVFLIAGIVMIFFNRGFELESKKRNYRYFISLFGFRFGKWESLPKIEYVSIFSTREYSLDPALRVDHEPGVPETFNIIHINLFYNSNRKITAFRTKKIKEAYKIAKEIAQILNVDILDATLAKSKWL